MGIHPLDAILHIANIIVLYVILRLLIYKPVRSFMNKRSERIQNNVEDAELLKKEAIEEKSVYDEKLSEIKKYADRQLIYSEERANEQAKRIISEAKKQAESIINNAREQARIETEKTMENMQDQIADAAVEIAQRILNREISVEDNRALFVEFFNKVE